MITDGTTRQRKGTRTGGETREGTPGQGEAG